MRTYGKPINTQACKSSPFQRKLLSSRKFGAKNDICILYNNFLTCMLDMYIYFNKIEIFYNAYKSHTDKD